MAKSRGEELFKLFRSFLFWLIYSLQYVVLKNNKKYMGKRPVPYNNRVSLGPLFLFPFLRCVFTPDEPFKNGSFATYHYSKPRITVAYSLPWNLDSSAMPQLQVLFPFFIYIYPYFYVYATCIYLLFVDHVTKIYLSENPVYSEIHTSNKYIS